MEYEILLSTMNKKSIADLKLIEKNIEKNCLIINQVLDENIQLVNEEIKEKHIRMISFREKGIALSRNRALENAKGDICILSDDDITFKKEVFENIVKLFLNKNIEIMTFMFEKNGKPAKKYKNKEFFHSKFTVCKVSSVEIAFNRKKIEENNLKFDTRFGLGAKYNSSEENIFLLDAMNKKLKIKFYPLNILDHPLEGARNKFDKNKFYGKGAFFKRGYGKLGLFLSIIFIILKYKKYKEQINVKEALNSILKGYKSI